MKALKMILKLATALAAVAGAIYALATYGDAITAWCRKIMDRFPGKQADFQPVTVSFTEDDIHAPEPQPEVETPAPAGNEESGDFAEDTDFVLPCDLTQEASAETPEIPEEVISAEEDAPVEEG